MIKRLTKLLLVLLTLPVLAHDLYLMPEQFAVHKGGHLVVALHNGDAFPESEISPVPERVRDMKLISARGTQDLTNLHVAGKVVQGETQIPWSGGLILTARTSPNAFTLGADEFNAYLKEEGLNEVMEWRRTNGQTALPGRERYSKYAKSLVTAGGNNNFHTKPVGLLIEIIPELSPGELEAGDRLPLRVLFRGKPAAGLQIESAWAGPNGGKKVTIAGRTDRNGRMEVPIGMSGKWRIHTLRMERCADSNIADWESYWASLTFEN